MLLVFKPLNRVFASPKEIEISAETPLIEIGRLPNSTVTDQSSGGTSGIALNEDCGLKFSSKVVSRNHARIQLNPNGRVTIQDVGSSSGTFVNKRRLSPQGQQSEQFELRDGDTIQIGEDFKHKNVEHPCVQMQVFMKDLKSVCESVLNSSQKLKCESELGDECDQEDYL